MQVVAIGGPPGTGKSTLATILTGQLQLPVLATDVIRQQLYPAVDNQLQKLDPTDPATIELIEKESINVQASLSEKHSRWQRIIDRQKESVYARLLELAGNYLATDSGVICDANFPHRTIRNRVRAIAQKHNATFTLIMLITQSNDIYTRLNARYETDPLTVSPPVAKRLHENFQYPDHTEPHTAVYLDTKSLQSIRTITPPEITRAIYNWLNY